jgi:hypothetical protein
MEQQVEAVYKKFDSKRKVSEAESADDQDLAELKELEDKIKKQK